MTDFDRNTRTLIVCFVVAVFFLVPLAVLNMRTGIEKETKVLGVQKVNEGVSVVKMTEETSNEIVLPNAGNLE